MNFVIIMTDTQNKSMVGAYGNPSVDTPNLDKLAASGVRFERAYTTCPLCTPARGAIFSGLYPQINGAWTNNVSPHANIALMGEIFQHYGYRTAYTGKWHLEGVSYFGDGVPGGGFEPDWWYDGKLYAEDIGSNLFQQYRTCKTSDALRQAGFTEEKMWGHRVANRAIDFLQQVGNDAFTLVVSFDEPHGPCVAPPEYWEKFAAEDIPKPPNHGASLEGKPHLQHIQRALFGEPDWERDVAWKQHFFGCNSYIDREIGRVIDTVNTLHSSDTVIIYTSDHGDMLEAHGLHGKGPMMYEEITNIPFIVRVPDGPAGVVSQALVSHLDIIPTMLNLEGIEIPASLHGVSLKKVLEDPTTTARDHTMINFHRFAINHDSFGEFYPIRCVTDGRYKLAVNLMDTDEFYDLVDDPLETHNRINDPPYTAIRDQLHEVLLAEMDRIRDPFRSYHLGNRPWRDARSVFYRGPNRERPQGFPFEPSSVL